ncbi:MAG: HD domain-containing protein [Clostridiales bacterium]|jgi:HD-GYP domain-containing protein (c-di-GMP phosphodiesterase class II)|nr:HD domain-containing protein [Clostridiales bacterium]
MRFDFADRLVGNITEFRKRENESIRRGFDKDTLTSHLKERAERNAVIMRDTNAIIDERLIPLLRDVESLSAGDIDRLFELSQKLYTITIRLDMGLALEIHKAAIIWAKTHNDTDRLIRHLYWAGLASMQIDPKSLCELSFGFFTEGAAYKDQYMSITNKETRSYINRCLGNTYVSISGLGNKDPFGIMTPFFACVDAALVFWSNSDVQAMDLDFPWDGFFRNARQNVCNWVDILRRYRWADVSIAQRIYENAQALGKTGPVSIYWEKNRYEYLRLTSSFHVNKLSYPALMDGLKTLFYSIGDSDLSNNGLYTVIHISSVLLEYMENFSHMSWEIYEAEQKVILERVLGYLKKVISRTDRQRLNNMLGFFTLSMRTTKYSDQYLDIVLRFTSFSHPSTYVHSLQVKNITMHLTDYFIEHEPGVFIGYCGAKDADEVRKKREEIRNLTGRAGLCHDIGKITYANTVSLCSRRLHDYEFNLIKEHVSIGFELQPGSESIECVKAAILGHHRWYDGSKGYPEGYDAGASKYAFTAYMVSAADSIDAATDTIGRSYAPGLTLEQIIKEIKDGAGTRYAPAIAQALNDDILLAKLRICITDDRKNSYFEVYNELGVIEKQEEQP